MGAPAAHCLGFGENLWDLMERKTTTGSMLKEQEGLHVDQALQLVIDSEMQAVLIAQRSDVCLTQAFILTLT